LLELPLALLLTKLVVLRDVFDLTSDFPEYFLAPSEGVIEDPDAHQAPLVDIRIHGSRRDQVDDGDALALLPVSVDTADALFYPHGIPRKIVVHDAVAELVIETFAADFGKQQQVQAVLILLRLLKTGAKGHTILIRGSPMDQPDAKTVLAEMVEEIAQGMPEAAEQHDLVVREALLVADDVA